MSVRRFSTRRRGSLRGGGRQLEGLRNVLQNLHLLLVLHDRPERRRRVERVLQVVQLLLLLLLLLLLVLLLLLLHHWMCVQRVRLLLLDPVQARPDRHRLDVADPVDAGQVAARLAERLVQPALQLLDAHHHVEVALRVLLDHVPHVVRFARLLKLPPCHEVLDLPDRPNRVPMRFRQSK
uniref:Uncharacterized protein n=1 Tax=Anopheles atroparvus TaxID=41427 RepID=A0A182JLZ2_ANOAO